MKTLFFSLLLFVFSFQIKAEETWNGINSKLPSEFNYLLEALQKGEFTTAEKRNLASTLKELDAELRLMNKEEIFLIIKGEIYKMLLTFHKGNNEISLDENQLNLLDKNLLEKGPKLNAFALWLMIALKSDAQVLLAHPKLSQMKQGEKSKELLLLRKKMSLISPWVQKFLSMEVDEFHNELRPILWDVFKHIENNARLFVPMGRFNKSQNSEGPLQFFTLKQSTSSQVFPELENWLRRLTLEKSETPKDEWQPKEALKNPNYVAPSVLPKPVDDWIDQSDWKGLEKSLLESPDSGPNSPKVLPKPVDDWILD